MRKNQYFSMKTKRESKATIKNVILNQDLLLVDLIHLEKKNDSVVFCLVLFPA